MDRNCCGDWRSNLNDLLPLSNGFLPPPLPIRRTNDGVLVIPTPEDTQETDSFCDLFFRQSIGLKPTTATGLFLSYDFYCPSVRNEITGKRVNFRNILHENLFFDINFF